MSCVTVRDSVMCNGYYKKMHDRYEREEKSIEQHNTYDTNMNARTLRSLKMSWSPLLTIIAPRVTWFIS